MCCKGARPDPGFESAVRARQDGDPFPRWLDEALQYATRFTCVSSHAAADLRRYAAERNMAPPIHVTRLAHEFVGFERNAEIPCRRN